MNKKFGAFLPVIFTILIICLFHFTHWVVVKYYPVVVNFLIFLMFFTSLFQKETVIQKMWINLRLQGFVFCTLQFRTDLIIFGKKLIDAVDHKVIVFVKGTDLILINGSADRHKNPFSRFGHRIAKMINSFGLQRVSAR